MRRQCCAFCMCSLHRWNTYDLPARTFRILSVLRQNSMPAFGACIITQNIPSPTLIYRPTYLAICSKRSSSHCGRRHVSYSARPSVRACPSSAPSNRSAIAAIPPNILPISWRSCSAHGARPCHAVSAVPRGSASVLARGFRGRSDGRAWRRGRIR